MPHRFSAAAMMLTISLMPAVVTAQGRSTARTPWGDPDLSGLWTNATLTLLQRPPELRSSHRRESNRRTPIVPQDPARSGRTTTCSSSEARVA
jgi:hypothetical protein